MTTSFIAVPHLEHERGLALGFVALSHAPCVRSVRHVLLDANAHCVAWFGADARNPRPGRRHCGRSWSWKYLARSALEHLPYVQGSLALGSEAQRSWVMAERNISRVIKGVTLRGTYSVKDGIVTVRTPLGSKFSQVGRRSKPGSVAYILLGELFYDVSSDAPEQPQ